jgi:hypothetical protein
VSLRDHVLLLVVIALTSSVALFAGNRRGVRRLGIAILTAVEVIGATTVFFAANLAIGVLLVLTVRRLTPFYPSLYEVADVALLILSLLQALIFETWRRTPRRESPTHD